MLPRRTLVKILVGVALLLILIFILRQFDPTGPLGKLSEKQTKQVYQNTNAPITNSPSREPVEFTHAIFNPEEIDWVSPLGESNGGYIEVQPLGGMTINIKKAVAQKGPINVYAPATMELEAYAYTQMDPEPTPDWSLYFRINPDLSLVLHHIKNASRKITDIVGNTPNKNDSRTTQLQWPKVVKFAAGEIIGTTTGTSVAKNWNVYLYDRNVKNQFVNQKRYEDDQTGQRLLQAACIFDYYQDQSIKESLYVLLGTTKPGETKQCGTASKDKKATLSGLWHAKLEGVDFGSYDGNYADPLSIYLRADKTITIYEMAKKTFTLYPNSPTYKNPELITDSHCYSLTDNWNPSIYKGYAFFRIDSETQMSVVYSPTGSCPKAFPTTQAKTYFR